jgi:hypothetical protein
MCRVLPGALTDLYTGRDGEGACACACACVCPRSVSRGTSLQSYNGDVSRMMRIFQGF